MESDTGAGDMKDQTVSVSRVGGGRIQMRSVPGHYDYENDKCICGVCGGLGMPWKGWFHCEDGDHVAVVRTGECFELVKEHTQ